jgi:hypothetical protein
LISFSSCSFSTIVAGDDTFCNIPWRILLPFLDQRRTGCFFLGSVFIYSGEGLGFFRIKRRRRERDGTDIPKRFYIGI